MHFSLAFPLAIAKVKSGHGLNFRSRDPDVDTSLRVVAHFPIEQTSYRPHQRGY